MTLFLIFHGDFLQTLSSEPPSVVCTLVCHGLWTCSLRPFLVVKLKTSSSQISVLLSPAQLLKVGPSRKKTHLMPSVGFGADPCLTAQVKCRFHQFFVRCGVFSCRPYILCFHSWASCLNGSGIEADLALQNCAVCFLLWALLGKLHWNVNTSKNNHYPKPISLSLHIWQPQSLAF